MRSSLCSAENPSLPRPHGAHPGPSTQSARPPSDPTTSTLVIGSSMVRDLYIPPTPSGPSKVYCFPVTARTVKLCVCLCWLCSVSYSLNFVKDLPSQTEKYKYLYGECFLNTDDISMLFDLCVTFIVPVTVIIALYLRIFAVAVSQARAMRSHITAVTLQHSVTPKAKKSELKAARKLGVLVLVFLTCFCPYFVVAWVDENWVRTLIGQFILFLYFFNSCLNPVIYAFLYPWFRKAVKLIVTLQILQHGSSETNML
ncbi:trace amine-associated receptor 7e-like [Sander lucioperca]|uniref:trace amine-associated receptor 7e-like n=1 Tax=Sander lucioperca TaxID=283035 RepID=UPI00125E2338|nr:trace amine-associated receptor 7e-like [Sander lucioperca]